MEPLPIHAWLIVLAFTIGYVFIILEHYTRVDKATVALLTGIVCWVIWSVVSSTSTAVAVGRN